MKSQTDICKEEILYSRDLCKTEIVTRTVSCKHFLDSHTTTCQNEIEKKTNTCKNELDDHIIKCKSEFDNNAAKYKEELKEASENVLHFITGDEYNPCNYESAREALKQQMKRYYSTRFRHTPLSVLMPLIDKPLMDIYVPPKIQKHVDGKTKCVDKYKDILMRDAQNNLIFLKGEAGTGKTTFATKVVLDWCSDSSKSDPTSQLRENFNDKEALHEYEFVFLVTLRDSPSQLEVMHIIKEQIIDNIYGDLDREKMYTLLQKVMLKEPCLVIQDGLDEWTYSDGKLSQPLLPTCYNLCTVLITTRPWKLENCIRDSCIGSLLEITGVNKPYMLANNILVSCYNEHNKDFNSEFKKYIDKNQLEHFLKVPMMLTMIVCLWVDGLCLKGTACQIYSSLLDSLLAKINSENEYFYDSPVFCLKNTHFIKPNIKFVKSIAKVAFYCLFSLEREKSLVFSEMEFNQYLQHSADKAEIKSFALNAGVLSQRRSSSFTNRSPSLSFVHKSIQEFLAAYYIADNMNVIDDELSEFVRRFDNGHLQICELFRFLCGLNIDAANKLSCVLYGHVARLSSNQPHFCKSRSFQKILISGFKEAKANRIDENHIHLKLSHIYFDFSLSSKTEMEIATFLMKANASNLRFWYIFGDAIPDYEMLVSEGITYNNVQENERMYKAHEGKYELFDISPCTYLESIHLFGQVTLLPLALSNLHNLKHITIQHRATVNGKLDLSASHSLETVDIGNIDVLFPTTLRGNMTSLKFTCNCDNLDLSLCHNLETIELSSGVQLNSNSINLQCKIKHLNILGSCDGLNLPPDHNIDTLVISKNVRLLPTTLRGNMENIELICMCSGLDLSLCNNLQEIELGPEITLAPSSLAQLHNLKKLTLRGTCNGLELNGCHNLEQIAIGKKITLAPVALRGRLKYVNVEGTCSGLDLTSCHDLESIRLGDDVILIPGSLSCRFKSLTLQCKCAGLDIKACPDLKFIKLGFGITLIPGPLPVRVLGIDLQCTCAGLDVSACHCLVSIALGKDITLMPGRLPRGVRTIDMQCKCSGLDISECHNLKTLALGKDITLLPGRLPRGVRTIDMQCNCSGLDISVCVHLESLALGKDITLLPGRLPNGVRTIGMQCNCSGLDISECVHLESLALGKDITLLPCRLPRGVRTIDTQCKCSGLDISECHYLKSIALGKDITLLPGRLPRGVRTIDMQCKCSGLDISRNHSIDSIALGHDITLLPVVLRGRVKTINLQCKCTRLNLSHIHTLKSIALGKAITLRPIRLLI
ncbi:hypothetical protein DPMN_151387 [Dreissena polymorpha]|uniref:NACHT domain-containing protein n=1 Tax=Dreissena polymorpha TaxID=45954 RepID=A0A9D4FFH8_DREPO|nr:hypothetical protein DPMN_151387 [Dreissena polymorpha]